MWRHRTLTRLRNALLIASLATLGAACAELGPEGKEPRASACCDCIVDNGCTTWSRAECGQWIHGTRSGVVVSFDCLDEHGCWPACNKEGVQRGG